MTGLHGTPVTGRVRLAPAAVMKDRFMQDPQSTDDAPETSSSAYEAPDPGFFLIGVGASAGGLAAIKQLLAQVPRSFPHSFAIVQHLSPDYKSMMPEILDRETDLTVREVENGLEVLPRHVYLIPPNANIIVSRDNPDPRQRDRTLRFNLVAPPPRPKMNRPIDMFFASLAEAVGSRSVGIILSGTGSDGTLGIQAIKEKHGFAMVQDPSQAEFDGMPTSAIATNLVDVTATPQNMIQELYRVFEAAALGISNPEILFEGAEVEFDELMQIVGDHAQIDFRSYKEGTLKRRIARRIALLDRIDTVNDYLRFVNADPKEKTILSREFLIGVTNFFRDLPTWYELQKHLPDMFGTAEHMEPVRIWSVGCSTGEEAYTLAILVEDWRRQNGITRDFRIFATDVNEFAIMAAKEANYPVASVDEIPQEMVHSDFIDFDGPTFRFTAAIRNKIIFSVHDLLEDAPFVRLDLLVCRNVLIYIDHQRQERVFAKFSFVLRDSGLLLVGSAEHVDRSTTGFVPLAQHARLYQNAHRERSLILDRGGPQQSARAMPRLHRLATRATKNDKAVPHDMLDSLLTDTQSVVFIVNEACNILETYGHYREYLELRDTSFSSNLPQIIIDQLRGTILLLHRQAVKDGIAEKQGIRVNIGGDMWAHNIFVRQVVWNQTSIAYSITVQRTRKDVIGAQSDSQPLMDPAKPGELSQYVQQLEADLESTQDLLATTTEDLGISYEELQTANEELTAANEEMQSNNEELQSVNEELHTVNNENGDRIAQLQNANEDIENLLLNADVATLFLTGDLQIRRFSAGFRSYFNLTPTDIGRPLADFTSMFDSKSLGVLMAQVETTNTQGEDGRAQLQLITGDYIRASIRPFLTRDGKQDGVSVSLFNLTQFAPTE